VAKKSNGAHDGPAASPPIKRDILPIPDEKFVGLTTYDAKDPDTKYPPIKPLRLERRHVARAHRPRVSLAAFDSRASRDDLQLRQKNCRQPRECHPGS